MADDKKAANRTMRSDPPAHPNEVLVSSVKGTMESIRNRKGVSDYIENEVEAPGTLHPSTESALEFPPEIQGSKEFKSRGEAVLMDLTSRPAAEAFMASLSEAPPTPELQDGGVQLRSFGPVSSEPASMSIRRQAPPSYEVERMRRRAMWFAIQSDVIEINGTLSGMPEEGVYNRRSLVLEDATIIRDPKKRPAAERFQRQFHLLEIRKVIGQRMLRFSGVRLTPLVKDLIKLELEQVMEELRELGLVEIPR